MRLITNEGGYHQRNFARLPFNGITFERSYDAFKVFRAINDQLPGTRLEVQRSLHPLFLHPSTTPKHLWNSVNIGPGKWVTSYEECLPFWGGYTPFWLKHFVWRRLAADSCRAIIAISDHARKRLIQDLEEAQFSDRRKIRNKVRVLHPPQEPLIEEVEQKPDGPPWKFVFVGTDFYRKGGAETVRAFVRLLDKGAHAELHLVTRVTQRPGTRTTEKAHGCITGLIDQHDRIVLHGKLPHEEVLELLRAAHVALLPSYRDTFGYSVLEAQAAGCPTITTNQCALPEINDEGTGWVIEVPLDGERGVQTRSPYGDDAVSTQIEEGIYSAAVKALTTPEVMKKKGQAALQRINLKHDPTHAVAELKKVYRKLR